MKRFFCLFLVLIVGLTACGPGGSGIVCDKGICVDVTIEGPVQALKPALFVITIQAEKDTPGLGVSFSTDPGVTLQDVQSSPKNAKLGYQDKSMLSWQIDAKGGEEYSFSGHVVIDKPTVSYGTSHYGVIVAARQPQISEVRKSFTIYLDPEGKQVDESQGKSAMETDLPLPTDATPYFPVTATPGSNPSVTPPLPSVTPSPLPSPTVPAYPPPGNLIITEPASNRQPSQIPTLSAYPNP